MTRTKQTSYITSRISSSLWMVRIEAWHAQGRGSIDELPQVSWRSCYLVFVALNPTFQKKQIAASCSIIVFSIKIYDTNKTDKLHHIANKFLTVNGSNWSLACAKKRVYWRTSPSFMEIKLLILYFRDVVTKRTRQTLYVSKDYFSRDSIFGAPCSTPGGDRHVRPLSFL